MTLIMKSNYERKFNLREPRSFLCAMEMQLG